MKHNPGLGITCIPISIAMRCTNESYYIEEVSVLQSSSQLGMQNILPVVSENGTKDSLPGMPAIVEQKDGLSLAMVVFFWKSLQTW